MAKKKGRTQSTQELFLAKRGRGGAEPIADAPHPINDPLAQRETWTAPRIREVAEEEAAVTARTLVRQCRTLLDTIPSADADAAQVRRELDGLAKLLSQADDVLHLIATPKPAGPGTAPVTS